MGSYDYVPRLDDRGGLSQNLPFFGTIHYQPKNGESKELSTWEYRVFTRQPTSKYPEPLPPGSPPPTKVHTDKGTTNYYYLGPAQSEKPTGPGLGTVLLIGGAVLLAFAVGRRR